MEEYIKNIEQLKELDINKILSKAQMETMAAIESVSKEIEDRNLNKLYLKIVI